MNAQIITTASGERLVVISETDYQALLDSAEDAADAAAVKTFRHRLAIGVEELVPAAVVDRILAGESRIRVWREHRGIASAELAEAAAIAPEALAAIEDGRQETSLPILRRIAAELELTLDDLAG